MHDSQQMTVAARNHPRLCEDTSAPITVEVSDTPEDTRAENRAVMEHCAFMGRRVRVRFQPEVWVKWGGKWNYRRARQRVLTLSCPNPEQAELAIEAIMAFTGSLDGKSLAHDPTNNG